MRCVILVKIVGNETNPNQSSRNMCMHEKVDTPSFWYVSTSLLRKKLQSKNVAKNASREARQLRLWSRRDGTFHTVHFGSRPVCIVTLRMTILNSALYFRNTSLFLRFICEANKTVTCEDERQSIQRFLWLPPFCHQWSHPQVHRFNLTMAIQNIAEWSLLFARYFNILPFGLPVVNLSSVITSIYVTIVSGLN